MSEYALILAAIAVGVFVAYQGMGNAIDQMVTWQSIDKDLLTPIGL
jgi:Flp pilus assembly pilin Flp